MLAAELRMGAFAAGWLAGQPRGLMIVAAGRAPSSSTVVLGGMRSLTWSGSAAGDRRDPGADRAGRHRRRDGHQLPAAAAHATGRCCARSCYNEAAQGLPVVDAPSLAFALPGDGVAHIAKRFTAPFGAIGPTAFVVAMLTVMAGIAASPWLLPRVTMTPGVYETRKSLGWATVFFGLIMLTAASVSVYMRDFIMDMVQGRRRRRRCPTGCSHLVELGFVARRSRRQRRLTFSSFEFAARHACC